MTLLDNQQNVLPPTVKEEKKDIRPNNDYLSKKERKHLNFIHRRMKAARDERDSERDEFDGMSYLEAYDRDTKSGLAFISPVSNNGENPISTGTTRQALISLIARAFSLNFSSEIMPFDSTKMALRKLGQALEIATEHAAYLDNDDEQIKGRINELFTHGDEMAYEDYVEEWGVEKSRPKFNGKIKGVNWSERKAKIFEGCRRRTVPGRRFYFGNIFTDSIDAQPYCYEVNRIDYAEAKRKYGHFERWKHVSARGMNEDFDKSAYAEDWILEDGENDEIEEIIYVDLPNKEMQVLLGGVPMLPIGFPTKWEHDKYPWAHQGAEPIRAGFIYHRSFVRTLLNMQDLENDIWRVLIMLAWNAALPAVSNQTGRVVTRRQLMAGAINHDIDADFVKPMSDGSLNNVGFVQSMAETIRENMNNRSVPELKQGIAPAASATATATIQTQREAEIAISLNLSAVAAMEGKLDRLRSGNILQNALKEGFAATSMRPGIGGVTRYVVEVVKDLETSSELMEREDDAQKREGMPVRILQVDKNAKDLIDSLEVRAVPKPKASTALDKQELIQMFQTAQVLFGQALDTQFFEDMFRSAYRVPADVSLTRDLADIEGQMGGGAPNAPKIPTPSPQSAVAETTPVA